MRAFVALPVLLIAGSSFAQAGSLDPGFGGDGISTTTIGVGADFGRAMAVQPDGRIVVAGYSFNGSDLDFAAVRYQADGALDASFGGDGMVTTPMGAGDDMGHAIALQADGRILVAGWSAVAGVADFAVVRYNTDGTLDNSLGGDGKVTTPIGTQADLAGDVIVQPDGKILVSGYIIQSDADFALVRYNDDGTLDESFSEDGKVITAVGPLHDYASSVVLQPDGRILVAGTLDLVTGRDAALVRYETNGMLDNAFGGDGIITAPLGSIDAAVTCVTIQPDLRIVVGGYHFNGNDRDFLMLRFLPDGVLDSSLNGNGMVITAIGNGGEEAAAVLIQPDSRILLAGRSSNGGNDDLAIVRYNADGTIDEAFDDDGKVTTPVGVSSSDAIQALALQSDGKIVAAGNTAMGPASEFCVARYFSGLSIGMAEVNIAASTMLVHPNPITAEAFLEFELSSTASLSCDLFDGAGRLVRSFLSDAVHNAGPHRRTLNLAELAAGHYALILRDREGSVSIKVVKE